MKVNWELKASNEDERVAIRNEFKESSKFRALQRQLLLDKVESNRVSMRNTTSFEHASWPYKQAYSLGYEAAIKEILSLLDD